MHTTASGLSGPPSIPLSPNGLNLFYGGGGNGTTAALAGDAVLLLLPGVPEKNTRLLGYMHQLYDGQGREMGREGGPAAEGQKENN